MESTGSTSTAVYVLSYLTHYVSHALYIHVTKVQKVMCFYDKITFNQLDLTDNHIQHSVLGFVYITTKAKAKATLLSDGFKENPI